MKLIGWGDVRMTARERPFAAEPSQLRKVLVRVFFALIEVSPGVDRSWMED